MINLDNIKTIQNHLTNQILVAATKYADVESMKELTKVGITHFGENKVQSLLDKYSYFNEDVTWHFIGTLQTNKVKYIIDKVSLIHSVDSYRLLDEIDKQAKKHHIVMPILIQVNISNEDTKHGFVIEETIEVFHYIQTHCLNIEPKGLMGMAPFVDAKETRIFFKDLKTQLTKLQKTFPHYDLTQLSMGMSNDYLVALEEGSTIIRIGSKLFK